MAARAGLANEDDDDIVRNMTNLILHNKTEGLKPWEKGLMALDSASTTCVTNVVRTNFGEKKHSKK